MIHKTFIDIAKALNEIQAKNIEIEQMNTAIEKGNFKMVQLFNSRQAMNFKGNL